MKLFNIKIYTYEEVADIARWRLRQVHCRECGDVTGKTCIYPAALFLRFAKNQHTICAENFGCRKKCKCQVPEKVYIGTEYREGDPSLCVHVSRCNTCQGLVELYDPLLDGTKPSGTEVFMIRRTEKLALQKALSQTHVISGDL
jgi:hypothetical protein